MTAKELTTIGRNTAVDFMGHAEKVPAKVDTGADSSSVWVSNVMMNDDGVLQFVLFGESSPFYTGEIITRTDYKVALVRSSSGHAQVRYKAAFSLRIANKRIRVMLNLSDRSRNKYPVLIGRRTLDGKFIVDVQISEFVDKEKIFERRLNAELKEDPSSFHKKQYLKEVSL